ncbi:meiotic recombination protein REC114 isoform X2 [Gouania willdenowi]|uniref:meiotic recombination protein REC114 isoform X2 n=1 Tax=Gouania willdenowi TaxID=441366 RepID=UPI001055EEDA|nr:meiotic recombination protein REC114 isoform X2 [Gouania willdenowi]
MASCLSWRLKRYGRSILASDGRAPSVWKDTISLHDSSSSLKVQKKSDNLFFRLILKGESRMLRMQFDGGSQAEAIKECSSAVKKLMEYVPVSTPESILLHPDQPPAEAPPPPTAQEKAVGGKQEVVQGMLSVKQLAQHYLGETTLTLPQEYSHSSLAQWDLKPILHVCLLDPGFAAFVEKVESELKKVLDE